MNRLVTYVMCGMVGINGISVAAESRPKLVVGIVVDQLRTDYVEYLRDLFSDGGFNRLMKEGAYIRDLDFKIPEPDVASSTAIIQTGTYPRHNGIASADIYNYTSKTVTPVFNDQSYIGNFTSETLSPAALRVTTLSDEIARAGNSNSSIHSISPDASQAIILSGHAGNSAFWLNDETGKWATTTYYTSPPATLQNKNYNNPLVSRLDTMKWTPLLRGVMYPDVTLKKTGEGFRYTFPRSDRNVYSMFKASPIINSDITEAAVDYIRTLGLGRKTESIDMLGLGFTLAPYPNTTDSDGRYELEDAYLRLDKNLEQILKAIDQYVGMDNALVYVTSTGYFNEKPEETSGLRLPGGTFSVKRALSLLNSYLSAKFGNASYVSTYTDGHLYLDRTLIEERGLDLNKVAEEVRDFMVRMSGVSDAYTVTDLMSPSVSHLEGHRLSSDPKTSGDVMLEFNPGWKVVDDTKYPAQDQVMKSTAFEAPAFISGGDIASQIIERPVDAAVIAPTVARILRIRSPNGSVEKPLNLKKK